MNLVGESSLPFAVTTLIVNAVSILIALRSPICAMLLQPASSAENAFSRLGQALGGEVPADREPLCALAGAVFERRLVCIAVAAGFVALFLITMKVGGAQVLHVLRD